MNDVAAYGIAMSDEVQKHFESLSPTTREHVEAQVRVIAHEAGRHHDANMKRWRTPRSAVEVETAKVCCGHGTYYAGIVYYSRREVTLCKVGTREERVAG
ncbi:hypothetical protein [Myxococcus sp. NMCA1]|uniref:hypothetical protein n=1 Tax=Myxococcus sp. NMCA1 TaxID=2996785 RepID=UPI0022858540|nr:hypothetical protein [Myxococcus sp. NMCA1]WAM23786.1 hypothetical protein OZ403_24925 [Myxococcus sp. NMCA1]